MSYEEWNMNTDTNKYAIDVDSLEFDNDLEEILEPEFLERYALTMIDALEGYRSYYSLKNRLPKNTIKLKRFLEAEELLDIYRSLSQEFGESLSYRLIANFEMFHGFIADNLDIPIDVAKTLTSLKDQLNETVLSPTEIAFVLYRIDQIIRSKFDILTDQTGKFEFYSQKEIDTLLHYKEVMLEDLRIEVESIREEYAEAPQLPLHIPEDISTNNVLAIVTPIFFRELDKLIASTFPKKEDFDYGAFFVDYINMRTKIIKEEFFRLNDEDFHEIAKSYSWVDYIMETYHENEMFTME